VNVKKLKEAAGRSAEVEQRFKAPPIDFRSGLGSVQQQANRVITQATILSRRTARESKDQYDRKWKLDGLLVFLFGMEYEDILVSLAVSARRLISQQPMVVEVEAPCRIIGDLHGQLRDLMMLFHAFGRPGDKDGVSFIFTGNLANYGCHQLEVLGLLLALKVQLPERVWLLRGNHEDRAMSEKHGLLKECDRMLGRDKGRKVYEQLQNVFDVLPFACLVEKQMLVVHSGIGDGKWNLSDLRTVRRPLTSDALLSPDRTWLANILWSTPIEDDDPRARANPNQVFGLHRQSSPCIDFAEESQTKFGWNVTKTFCAQNGLQLIVRSHQCKSNGFGFDVMHDDSLIRIYSARDHQDYGNDAAVLFISQVEDDAKSQQRFRVRPQVLRSVTKTRAQARAAKTLK